MDAPPDPVRSRPLWWGAAAAVVVVAASILVPRLLDWQVWAREHPEDFGTFEPLHGFWHPELLEPMNVWPVLLAVLACLYGPRLAEALRWRTMLAVAYAASLAWLLTLALTDGEDGVARVLDSPDEYLETARATTDIGAMLSGFIAHIPIDSTDNWPTHVAGHPPGALLGFVWLDRIGLGDPFVVGLVATAIAATTAPAVLITLERLGAVAAARRAAPLLVMTPAAVFMAVSADAVFGAFAAWGLAALAAAATAVRRRSRVAWSVVAGLLLGWCVMCSYGLPLIGLIALAVLVAARGSWAPLPIAAVAALAVVLVFAWAGFAWWEAYPVLHDRYYDGLAAMRPWQYWTWGNIGALLISGGLLLGPAVAALAVVVRRGALRVGADPDPRAVAWLAVAGLATMVVADLSQMSRAETERIWLPFLPWLATSFALLPDRWRRVGLVAQVVLALAVQTLLYTTW